MSINEELSILLIFMFKQSEFSIEQLNLQNPKIDLRRVGTYLRGNLEMIIRPSPLQYNFVLKATGQPKSIRILCSTPTFTQITHF